jgi:hypothetical protein
MATASTDENYLSDGGEIEEDLSLSIKDSEFARPLSATLIIELHILHR